MIVMLNSTQLDLFKELIIEVQNNNVDLNQISQLKSLPHFRFWMKALNQLCDKIISNEENKTLNQTIEIYIQDLLISYFDHDPKRFDKRLTLKLFENFFNYIKNEKNTLFYFTPLYNFEFDGSELCVEPFVKIRKIFENERNYLFEYYDKFSPVKVSVNKIKYLLIITVDDDVSDPSSFVENKIYQVLNKFKIINDGNIRSGGLYNFDKSEKWNPRNKFHRIRIEPVGISSNNKYTLRKKHSEKFQELILKITKQYPDLSNDELELSDVFDRVIRRFSGALEKEDKSEKIVDLVLCLEILLVSVAHDSTLKISQRTALFIGKSIKEKLEISDHMISFYNFRSGQVHEFKDRPVKVEKTLTKDFVIKKLESWTRRSILQMFYFSQEKKYSKLTFRQLLKKIDESMFNVKINSEFLKLSNENLKRLKF